jgi:hypothetical protein
VLVVLALLVGVAHADNRTEAILLFDQGSKELKAGQFEKACNSFERSLALYQDSGTKGSLARCYEKLGRLASSWLMWRELADLAPNGDLRRDAAAQAAKLEPRVAHYVIKAQPTAGLAVTINGKPTSLSNLPIPIDAGGVIVRGFATGYKDWSGDYTVTDGQTLNIEIPALEPVKIEEVKKDPIPVRPPPPPPTKSKRKLIGIGVAVAGGGAIVFGAALGLKAQNKFSDAKDTCGGSVDDCDPANLGAAQKQVDSARSAGNFSTLMFAAGGALVAGGIVLVVTAPKIEKQVAVSPLALPNATGVVFSGRF